VKTKLTT